MSEELIEKFEAKLRTLDKVVQLGIALIAGAFALGLWVATLEFRVQTVDSTSQRDSQRIGDILLWKAETASNRYTTSDAARDKAIMLDMVNIQDKRLARTEDGFARLEKAIDRIETKIGSKTQ